MVSYPQPVDSSAPVLDAPAAQRRIRFIAASARSSLAEVQERLRALVSSTTSLHNPVGDSPARTSALGHIAGLATKISICDSVADLIADADFICTAHRVHALVCTPWGCVSVGDHCNANRIAGSRQIVSEVDLISGCISSDRPPVVRVSPEVHSAIARLVFAANRGPENIACQVSDDGQTCTATVHNPQVDHTAQLSSPADCPTVWRPDLIVNEHDRLQLDLDSARGINQRLCAVSTAAEQVSPVPRLTPTNPQGYWVTDSHSALAVHAHLAQHEAFGRTHGRAALEFAKRLDSVIRDGRTPIPTDVEPEGPVFAAEISLGPPPASATESDTEDSGDELAVQVREDFDVANRALVRPLRSAPPLKTWIAADFDDSSSDDSDWINTDDVNADERSLSRSPTPTPPPTPPPAAPAQKRKSTRPRRHPYYTQC